MSNLNPSQPLVTSNTEDITGASLYSSMGTSWSLPSSQTELDTWFTNESYVPILEENIFKDMYSSQNTTECCKQSQEYSQCSRQDHPQEWLWPLEHQSNAELIVPKNEQESQDASPSSSELYLNLERETISSLYEMLYCPETLPMGFLPKRPLIPWSPPQSVITRLGNPSWLTVSLRVTNR